jgi:carboxylate/amino acid/amine transporter
MRYLVFITLIWSFSFSLIGVYLSKQVDSDFAVLTRIVLAGLTFLPFTVWRVPARLKLGVMGIGALQFGVTYLCLYRSFAYLSVPEVLLFTILTPIYVTLIDDVFNQHFSPAALLASLIAVVGAGVIRYAYISPGFFVGFMLLQIANFTFAIGQVGYKHLLQRIPCHIASYRYFGYFYLGALCIALPSFILFGNSQLLPTTPLQWGILIWLGIVASAFGFYGWNKGACLVDAGTLGIMNNAFVPIGLMFNLLIWHQQENMPRLLIGGLIIAFSLWLNYHYRTKTRFLSS